jgi:membrane-bound metal-dependent hydrolase YbcI (DUF457 family)
MTTFFGHAATGAAIYLGTNRLTEPHARWALPLLVFLAVAPDFDYIFLWLFNISPQPRISHSLSFCFIISSLTWALTIKLRHSVPRAPTLAIFILASVSHLALDLLVGVHSLPIFWPFTASEVILQIGILPSTIHVITFPNHYFWRNLFIECGVLLPFLAALIALFRATPFSLVLPKVLLIGPFWIACILWSLSLQR